MNTTTPEKCPWCSEAQAPLMGAPIVSDYDKISAEFWEHFLAIVCVVTGRKP